MHEAIITFVTNADERGVETHVYRIEFDTEDAFEVWLAETQANTVGIVNMEKLGAVGPAFQP